MCISGMALLGVGHHKVLLPLDRDAWHRKDACYMKVGKDDAHGKENVRCLVIWK